MNTFCGDARAAAAIFNRMDPVLRNAVEAGALFGARENLGDHDHFPILLKLLMFPDTPLVQYLQRTGVYDSLIDAVRRDYETQQSGLSGDSLSNQIFREIIGQIDPESNSSITAEQFLLTFLGRHEPYREIINGKVSDYESWKRELELHSRGRVEQGELEGIERFGRELVAEARAGRIHPVIGRDREIADIYQILKGIKKPNVLVHGDPGVGKTAMGEKMALEIAAGIAPEYFKDAKIFELDLGALMAGAKHKGDFEARLREVIAEIQSHDGVVILMIDEFHMIMGAGGTSEAMTAANLLKPVLARGNVQSLAMTTTAEKFRFIDNADAALARRFRDYKLHEPERAESLEILRGVARDFSAKFQAKHGKLIRYTEEAIERAYTLGKRYLSGRFMPDAAIDLLEDAGTAKLMEAVLPSYEIGKVKARLDRVSQEIVDLSATGKYEELGPLQVERAGLEEQLTELKRKYDADGGVGGEADRFSIGENEIAREVEKRTGIPAGRVMASEREKLLALRASLDAKIFGQEQVTREIARFMIRSRVGMRDPTLPAGVFMFLGPTGVGKTHTAKTLAEEMFDNGDGLVRIDMGDYLEKESGSRLIGPPPGYVGYEQGGQLTDPVRNNPYSVVLFDEVEKAHPDVLDLLLKVLDEGTMTDAMGNVVDFSNTVIVFTSNLDGEALPGFFRPEFLGRVDKTVEFNPITDESARMIFNNEVKKQAELAFQARGVDLQVDDSATNHIIGRIDLNGEEGARPLRRLAEEEIGDLVAMEFLENGEDISGWSLKISHDGSEFKVELEPPQ